QVEILIPADLHDTKQYAEAMVWSGADQQDVELVQIIDASGKTVSINSIPVGEAGDEGNTMVLPGDPSLGNVFRSLGTMSDIHNDPRKKQLVDDGKINRDRQ